MKANSQDQDLEVQVKLYQNLLGCGHITPFLLRNLLWTLQKGHVMRPPLSHKPAAYTGYYYSAWPLDGRKDGLNYTRLRKTRGVDTQLLCRVNLHQCIVTPHFLVLM